MTARMWCGLPVGIHRTVRRSTSYRSCWTPALPCSRSASDPANDTPPLGDAATGQRTVTLRGSTEAGLSVELEPLGMRVTADVTTGEFAVANVPLAMGPQTFEAFAADAAGNRGSVSAAIERFFCFEDQLPDWSVRESGGTDAGRGSVVAENCQAVLREGDSFEVALERTLPAPAESSVLRFTYSGLEFDTTDTAFDQRCLRGGDRRRERHVAGPSVRSGR